MLLQRSMLHLFYDLAYTSLVLVFDDQSTALLNGMSLSKLFILLLLSRNTSISQSI